MHKDLNQCCIFFLCNNPNKLAKVDRRLQYPLLKVQLSCNVDSVHVKTPCLSSYLISNQFDLSASVILLHLNSC